MKRILLLVATNVAVLLVLSVTLRLLGVDRILDERGTGLNFTALLIFSAVLGFGGSLISLAMSKFIAKRMMGVRVIEQPRDAAETWLVETVRRQATAAGIGMPEVGIFDAPDMNAFATGPRRNNALVAVSSGSRDLFHRHGYHVHGAGPIHLPDNGPPLWPMWRDPQGGPPNA